MRRRRLGLRAAAAALGPGLLIAGGPAAAAPPAGYWLAWADECGSWDTSKFDHWLYGARRDAYNTWQAVTHAGGIRTIRTYTEGGTHYTGMISTQGRFQERYGYWEARVDYTGQRGMWSAFWMQSPTMGSPVGNVALAGAEIDISEHREYDSSGGYIAAGYDINVHWDGYGADHQSSGSRRNVGDARWGYHTYGLLWTPSSYRFDYDGASPWTLSSGVSHRSEFIVLSSEVENGSWAWTIPAGGYGTNGAATNPQMWIDYVRWYAPSNRVYWSGAGSGGTWADTNNWVGGRTPAADRIVNFTGFADARRSHALDAERWVAGLCVTEPGAAVAVSNHTLHVGSSGVDLEVANQDLTLHCGVALDAAQTWDTGSRTVAVRGRLSGAGALTKAGAGTLSLAASNTFTGPVYVEEGSLHVAHADPFGAVSGGTAARAGAQVMVMADGATAESFWLNGAGPSGDGAFRVGGGRDYTVNGRVYLDGSATVKLDGGTSLNLNHANAVAGTDVDFTMAGDGGSVGTVRGAIGVGDGRILKDGEGTWIVDGDQDWSAAHVYVRDGTLRLDDAAFVTADWGGIGPEPGDGGTLRLAGTARYTSTADFNIADVSNTTGTLEIDAGATLLAKAFYVGKSGNASGTVHHRGAVSNTAAVSEWRVGGGGSTNDARARGVYNMLGGSFHTPGNLQIGAYGTGTLAQTAGTVTVGGWPVAGRFVTGVGTITLGGGAFHQTDAARRLIVGESGAGELVVSGTAALDCAGGLRIGQLAGSRGTVRLNGGTAAVRQVETLGGTSALYFNGGILRAGTNHASFLQGIGLASLESGGGTIDSGGWTVTVAQALSGAGALRKSGSGMLILAGANTHAGGTVVSAGTLRVSSPAGSATGTGPVDVRSGATLGGTGSISGSVTVAGILSPGSGVGTLSTGPQTWPAGGQYVFEVESAASSDRLLVGGALTVTAGAGSPFLVRVVSLKGGLPGPLADFDGLVSRRWALAETAAGVSAAAGSIRVDPAGFAHDLRGGQFLTAVEGTTLWLVFRAAADFPRAQGLGPVSAGEGPGLAVEGGGVAGVRYHVEASTNLLPPVTWTQLGVSTGGPAGLLRFLDPLATNFPRRFYRFREASP